MPHSASLNLLRVCRFYRSIAAGSVLFSAFRGFTARRSLVQIPDGLKASLSGFLHVFPLSAWIFSGGSGFLEQSKNMRVEGNWRL